METVFLLVAIAITVIAGTALSERLRIAAPMLLIAVGIVASYLPFIPEIHLEPEVVLLGLLPPLLYSTAIQTSLLDVRANVGNVLQLSVVLVVVTTAAVACVVMWLLPSVGWPVAVAIGAVVAPPDAVAATAVARRIGLPRRVVTILEAESLLNDATALVALRTAIAAIAATVSVGAIEFDFLRAAGGGLIIGLLVFIVVAWVRRRLENPLLDTAVSFVTPFAAYLIAERIHSSGVIAVVVAGILLGHKAPIIQNARSRITETITWRTIAFLLENAVFLLIGLQTRSILAAIAESDLSIGRVILVCLAVLACVIVVRVGFVFAQQGIRDAFRPPSERMPRSSSFVIGWAGMRGVVTLAAALLIPETVPHHEVLLLIALTVVVGTLFGQGLTLPLITRALKVDAPDPASDALARATVLQQAADAGLRRLNELDFDDQTGVVDQIRTRLDQRTFAAWERLSTTTGAESPSDLYARIRIEMIDAERARVLEIRSEGRVPSDVVREVLGMLDLEESMIDVSAETREFVRAAPLGEDGGDCPDLLDYPAVETAKDAFCQRCRDEGTHTVALRQCLVCGNVACCDSSPGQHATAHFHDTGHAVMESAEPGENWRWCYVHLKTS
ncbi:Na+/H+ antiporter [Tessaracoccus aquimaris]|uniref:Na+/H+ antiporter n=1 Tax=Tessaracoccus aquimaris TaxID=1332264 RepID=A0A1Q2CPJ3_9ACTN|nr:Na+/H+ antiporter [Tessaracoccus aquimaris]AQP48026.1 Na+/H+ antiporter [Tessaracoccus aquimaris]